MFTDYLTRGVKAGLAAGLVFGLLMALVANPLVVYADDLGHASGEHHDDVTGDHHQGGAASESHEASGHHDTAVSNTVTNVVSVASGALWAVLLGVVVFGIAFYFLEPAIPGSGATKSFVLAAAGFVTVSGAPWLLLPPQAPGVEQSLTANTRLLLYGGMMVAGALACVLSGLAYNRVEDGNGRITATVAAVVPFGLLAVPVVLGPSNTVENALPADLAAGMTGMIVFGQALLWLLLAATHAWLHEAETGHRQSAETVSPSRSTPTAD